VVVQAVEHQQLVGQALLVKDLLAEQEMVQRVFRVAAVVVLVLLAQLLLLRWRVMAAQVHLTQYLGLL
jgi:hypothetical protein